MRWRVGILDLTAALVVLVVLVLPDRSLNVKPAYQVDRNAEFEIALYQARLAADPGDSTAALRLSEALARADQTDWAVQVAAATARHEPPDLWRALWAISLAHAERREVIDAHKFAEDALNACRAATSDICPPDQKARLTAYHTQLEAGAMSGIDLRANPRGYEEEVFKKTRIIRFRGATPRDIDDGDGGDSPGP